MNHLKFIVVAVLTLFLFAFAIKDHTIKGTVYGINNQPVSGAIIQEKGTSNAVTTDVNGKFTITLSHAKASVIVTAVGFNQKEINVTGKSILAIRLDSSGSLEEVVVIGYGKTVTKSVTSGMVLSPVTKGRKVYSSPSMPRASDNWGYNKNFSREGYDNIKENQFLKTKDNPLSTFSIDVDGASYSNIRRFLKNDQLPPDGAVRIEEMINYFNYNYPQPNADKPFSINTEFVVCPWNNDHQLISIGLQGKKIPTENLPPSNFVFLIDVSGSMMSDDKLPLVKASMKLLTDQLRPQDKIAIVVYAGRAGLVLPATNGNEKTKIKNAIEALEAGGSTAGGAGIKLAYEVAANNYLKTGNNRVVLCTDGDFNVGVSSDDELERLIEEKRKSGVYLSVLGYGTGNYQDAKMQKLANKGNGNHSYIDDLSEAKRVLISQFGGTMFTIAKDVKLQIEFNPAGVQGYRLIGYENRMLAKEDFNDDKKDAGELGSGHTVTALYEIIPVGVEAGELKKVDDLKYQKPTSTAEGFNNKEEVMTIKFRYKKPDENSSRLLQEVVKGNPHSFKTSSNNIHLAAAVAQFGMLLRNSEFKGVGGFGLVENLLNKVELPSSDESKLELVSLLKIAEKLSAKKAIDDDDSGEQTYQRKRLQSLPIFSKK